MGQNIKKLFSLSGKVVILTGAAGQLGGEYVRTMLKAGACVAAFDIRLENPKGTLRRINSKKLLLVNVDVVKKDSVKRGLNIVLSRFGNPRVLINNAAIDTPPNNFTAVTGPFEKYPEDSWDDVMNVNLKGTFLCSQIIGGHMAKTGGGNIINISSIYGILSPDQRIYEYKKGKTPFYKPAVYSVSKSGIINFTRYLATYWAKKNVRVNTLTLGGVYNHQDKTFIQNYSQKVPLGRMATQSDYNGAMLFLASEASSYMTGANLIVDGGYSCW